MDLPTCPTCGQSVLDEDETDCPFCGAALKGGASKGKKPGKPTPKIVPKNIPAVQAPVAVQPPVAVPNPGPKAPPAVISGKPPAGEEEDPFAVDQSHLAGAVPVQPKKSAGKSLEVVCPMCETHGFVPPSTAGKQARCCNPKCLVPVFEVPLPKQEAPPPPPKPPLPIGKWIGQAAVVAAVIGVIAFWWTTRKIDVKTDAIDGLSPGRKYKTNEDEAAKKKPKNDLLLVAPEKTPYEWQRDSMLQIIELAREPGNSRKPTCRQLSATAALASGNLEQAQIEIDQIAKVSQSAAYEAVSPLCRLAWAHWQAKRKPEFEKAVNAAVAAALAGSTKLPEQGRQSAQSAIELATVLALAGRAPEGYKLLATRQNGESANDAAAAVEIARHDGSFDVDQDLPGQSIGGWERPLSTAVTRILMLHGETVAAKAWGEKDPDELSRTESVLMWAMLVARDSILSKKPAGRTQAAAAVEKLSTAARVCYQSRLAEMLRDQKQAAAADEALIRAEEAVTQLRAPEPVRLSDVKEFFKWGPPIDPAARLAAARAAAELAIVQFHFGKQEAAAKTLGLATAQLRSLAPSLAAIDAVHEQVLGGGTDAAYELLKKEFTFFSADEERIKLTSFKQKEAGVLRPAGEMRFRLQQKIVLAAIEQGLLDAAAQEINARAGAQVTDPNEREFYLATTLPQLLTQRMLAAGKPDPKFSLVGNQEAGLEAKVPLARDQASLLVAQDKVAEAAAELNPFFGRGLLQLETLRFACRLARAGKFELARDYLMAIQDESVREDGLRFISAQTVLKTGEAKVFEAARQELKLQAIASSLLCGLVEGSARRPAQSPAKVDPTPGKSLDAKKPADKNKS